MAKPILISERPGESGLKQSIGNYKGVMLCNRPNDLADRPSKEGPAPFISRVVPREQLGINPAIRSEQKPQPKPKKTREVLKKHRIWLIQLQKQKEEDLQKEQEALKAQEEKLEKMKKKPKVKSVVAETVEEIPELKPAKLTEKALKMLDKETKVKEKPKWALTKEENELQEEAEVDGLLQYVQDLDYDSIIDDIEVREALEIVKERVEEIKKDKEWKRKIAEKYNEEEDGEVRSVGSRSSYKSFVDKARSQVEGGLEGERKREAEWDRSTRTDKVSVNDDEKVAKIVADQVLANYPNLKSIHSNASVRRMLEREAKNQLCAPVIATIKEERPKMNMNNLPYLHRNPAV